MRWHSKRTPPIHIRCESIQRRYGDFLALRDIVESSLEALQISLVSSHLLYYLIQSDGVCVADSGGL
jgi:hypothetical protein